MHREIADALEPHAGWLANLRWIGRWEPIALALGAAGTVVAAVCGANYLGAAAGAELLIGHLLILAAVIVGVARPYSAALLALTGLSGLHAWLTLMQGLPHGQVIALGYFAAGLVFAALAGVAARRNEPRWRALAQAAERDDFRWIVTRAPLLLRWFISRYFASRADIA